MRPSRTSPTFASRRPPGSFESSANSEAATDTFNPSALRLLTRLSNSVSCSVNFSEFFRELRVAWNFSGGRDDLRLGLRDLRVVSRSGGGGGPQPGIWQFVWLCGWCVFAQPTVGWRYVKKEKWQESEMSCHPSQGSPTNWSGPRAASIYLLCMHIKWCHKEEISEEVTQHACSKMWILYSRKYLLLQGWRRICLKILANKDRRKKSPTIYVYLSSFHSNFLATLQCDQKQLSQIISHWWT